MLNLGECGEEFTRDARRLLRLDLRYVKTRNHERRSVGDFINIHTGPCTEVPNRPKVKVRHIEQLIVTKVVLFLNGNGVV